MIDDIKRKTDFDTVLNNKTTKELTLSENQKKLLKDEYIQFSKSQKLQLENFISKKREYIEDFKYTSMTQYLEKLKEESEAL